MKAGSGLHTLLMKFTNKQFIKFVIVGITNTALSYVIYLLLILFMPYSIAYSISYVLGIPLSYILNSLFVFYERFSLKKIVQYPIVYLVQFIINFIFMHFLIDLASIDQMLAPIIVTAVSVPITFLLSKHIISK